MQQEIMVSVICNVYNHERYVRQMLESVVTQKTNFPFEVLVHDDASTDNTADIVREYEQKYSELIKPIYQTENQYSQGVSITKKFQYPRVKGKYIAFCEGDDYWTDSEKLQKQVNAMELNPTIGVCVHRAEKIREGVKAGIIAPRNNDCIIPAEDVIAGGGMFVATNSLLFRTEVITEITPIMKIMSYDFVLQIQGSLPGGMLYLNDCMSAYRIMVKGSWSSRMVNNTEKYLAHKNRVHMFFETLDNYTQFKYHSIIAKKLRENEFEVLRLKRDYRSLFSKEYRDVRKSLTWKKKLIILREMITGRR